MPAPDPTDLRLLALVADVGRVAVHDLARRTGLDVREVAARLAALAAAGLPLVVGVECDPAALRYALSTGRIPGTPGQPGQPGRPGQPGVPAWAPAAAAPTGPPSGPLPQPALATPPPTSSPSGPLPQPVLAAPTPIGSPSGPLGGPAPAAPGPANSPSGPSPVRAPVAPWPINPPSGPVTVGPGANPAQTWGPPGSAAWVRRDDPPGARRPEADAPIDPLDEPRTVRTVPSRGGKVRRAGAVGDTLHADELTIKLVEVVDPADFLFTAAGYKLQPGERSVVVHTELTNRGAAPLTSLADLYLVLLDAEGQATSKAPVALTSRPPHRVGVKPGETVGGHTVYVLPEGTELAAIRWSPSPDGDQDVLTWKVLS